MLHKHFNWGKHETIEASPSLQPQFPTTQSTRRVKLTQQSCVPSAKLLLCVNGAVLLMLGKEDVKGNLRLFCRSPFRMQLQIVHFQPAQSVSRLQPVRNQIKSKKLFNRLNNCFVLYHWWRCWTPLLLAERFWAAKGLKGWSAATQLIAGWGETCLFFRSLKPSLSLELLAEGHRQWLLSPASRQDRNDRNAVLSVVPHPGGGTGVTLGWSQPGPRSEWWDLSSDRDCTDREQSCCSPVTELGWFSSAKPEDSLLSSALLSAPCQGCQLGSVTQSHPGGTGTEQITRSSKQRPEVQWGGTQLCMCAGGCLHFAELQHCDFWI